MEMIERKDPEFVKFAVGEVIEGILANIERIEVGTPPKKATRYTLEDVETGNHFCFLGSYQLDTKLRPKDHGHYVTVRYEGEDKSVNRNGNNMKSFKVCVSKDPYRKPTAKQLDDGTFITDDDLPNVF